MMTLLSAISGQNLLQSAVWLVVAGLIFWVLTWFITYCAVPEPFNKVAKVIVALVAVILIINELLGLAGSPFIKW